MKLSSGTITINKEIREVYKFSVNLDYFAEDAKIYDLEDYVLETDDDIKGPLEEGDDFSVYLFAKYEGDKDIVFDLEVLHLSENNFVTFKIKRIGIYQNDEDEYDDVKVLPLQHVLENVEMGIIFTESQGITKVKLVTYIKPSAGIFIKVLAWLFNASGYLWNKQMLRRWGDIVEKYA